ncbi:MAG: plastocyanin/azurin family copper-binding protein [Nitrososphaeraceae archaeon]|nr:plastocyanin/azurin family copper-binding protein [Nitrososphaeraceae archaeon]
MVPSMQPQSDGSSSSTATQNKILTVIINNARDTNTVVIDFTGKNIQYLNPNANYTMDGTESHINSGVMLPEDQADPEAPPNSKFTITFDNRGTYDYVCLFHPWMTGSVKVE